MLEKYLQEIGLSDKEALVYLALLQVDNDSVLDLAKKTKINRTTIYPVLESLSKKGLISEIKIDKKVRFQAEPPERLETFVERQKVVLDERASRLKDIVPQLKSVQREIGERPVVKYFEGREGIISSMEEFFGNQNLEEGTQYILFSRDLIEEVFTDKEREKFRNIRKSNSIKAKAIYTYTHGELPPQIGDTAIRVDEKKYPITCDISIYKDQVRISILGKPLSSILIKSNDFARTFQSLIEYVVDSKK
jgi:predicted transcriptional regulator